MHGRECVGFIKGIMGVVYFVFQDTLSVCYGPKGLLSWKVEYVSLGVRRLLCYGSPFGEMMHGWSVVWPSIMKDIMFFLILGRLLHYGSPFGEMMRGWRVVFNHLFMC